MTVHTVYRGQVRQSEKLLVGGFRNLYSIDEFVGFLGKAPLSQSTKRLVNRLIPFITTTYDAFRGFMDDLLINPDSRPIRSEYIRYLLRHYLASYRSFEAIMKNFTPATWITQEITMAIMQHYGVAPTPMLDVTWDESIATWFATHVFRKDGTTGKGHYEPLTKSRWGFLYVIRIDSGKLFHDIPLDYFLVDIGLIDLRMTRIKRQRAAAIQIPWEPEPFDKHLELDLQKIFDIETIDLKEKYKDKKYRHLSDICQIEQAYLFPGPNEDFFLRRLKENGLPTFP